MAKNCHKSKIRPINTCVIKLNEVPYKLIDMQNHYNQVKSFKFTLFPCVILCKSPKRTKKRRHNQDLTQLPHKITQIILTGIIQELNNTKQDGLSTSFSKIYHSTLVLELIRPILTEYGALRALRDSQRPGINI